jgi:dihydroneopterin aldolase
MVHTTLTISGLQTYGYHGMFDAERQLGQKFIFDVCAKLAPTATHLSDQLHNAVRYDELVDEIIRLSEQSTFRTLEALAEAAGRRLLERYSVIHHISVAVAKLSPPMPHTLQRVGIEIHLDRDLLQSTAS